MISRFEKYHLKAHVGHDGLVEVKVDAPRNSVEESMLRDIRVSSTLPYRAAHTLAYPFKGTQSKEIRAGPLRTRPVDRQSQKRLADTTTCQCVHQVQEQPCLITALDRLSV